MHFFGITKEIIAIPLWHVTERTSLMKGFSADADAHTHFQRTVDAIEWHFKERLVFEATTSMLE